MNRVSVGDKEAGQKAEKLFRKYCDKANITYLYIDQEVDKKSSEIFYNTAQRPDYLVAEANKMPFFVDVKAHYFQTINGVDKDFYKHKNIPAILWNNDEYLKLESFQNMIGIPIWISFFERRGTKDVNPRSMLVIPLNIAGDFFLLDKHKFTFFQIPRTCCALIDIEKPTPLSYGLCSKCENDYCDKIDKYLI